MKTKISITINKKTLGDIDSIIDNVYIRNRSQAIEHLAKNALGENKTAVIMAGGAEEKLKIGDNYRMTVKVKNSTLVEVAIGKLRDNGFKTIYIVARPKILTRLFEILKDGSMYGVKVNYVEEGKSNGTADSLKLLKGKINSNFLVVYGDLYFNKIKIDGLWNEHIKQNSVVTIVLTTSSRPSEKGTVKVEGNKVLNFTQKPKESDIYLVFSPIFVTGPEIFEYSGASLEKDVFPILAERGLLNAHLSSEKEVHVHTMMDVNKVRFDKN
jgi:NDP-sugar pyrophosphorylase family protein|tara:strand:- start:1269 stop:2075 length:807 start_codon:yes stop_codon:yes gene_type:complete